MRSLVLISCLFVFAIELFAQDTIAYRPLIDKRKGRHVKVKYRSSITGQKTRMNLRKGDWVALDEAGEVLVKTRYKAIKRSKLTYKHGIEVYYLPGTSDTLLLRKYYKGSVVEQQGFEPCILDLGRSVVHIYPSFDGLAIAEYVIRRGPKPEGHVVSIDISNDLGKILNDTAYHRYEDKVGDPELLVPSKYSAKHRFNHISNPEMEYHPMLRSTKVSFTKELPGWSIASESPDAFIAPDGALSGDTYLGFRVFTLHKHVEYLQNHLIKPLVKDSIYCFTAHLRLSVASMYATNAFGFLLTDKATKINTDELLTIQPSKHLNDQLLNYKTRWMKVQCTYKAIGGEQYLVLGSFQNHKELQLVDVGGVAKESYYYLDDVSLVPITDPSACGCNFSRNTEQEAEDDQPEEEQGEFDNLEEGSVIVLEDIHFENDEAELLPESYPALYDLLKVLLDNQEMVIELGGHTSGVGSYAHNVELSRRRAEAVRDFVTLYGVNKGRVQVVGYGPDQRIADDATAEGQRQNRRVEFKVLKLTQ